MNTYHDAYRTAAEAQGLGPFIKAATDAGIPVELWQTGGWIMVAAIQSSDPARFYSVTHEDGYLLCKQTHADWDEGTAEYELVLEGLTAEDVLRRIAQSETTTTTS